MSGSERGCQTQSGRYREPMRLITEHYSVISRNIFHKKYKFEIKNVYNMYYCFYNDDLYGYYISAIHKKEDIQNNDGKIGNFQGILYYI